MKSISILGCGWLGLPLGKDLAEKGFLTKGSTTREDKLLRIEEAGIKPYLFAFGPQAKGEISDFFDSDILIINLPPRNQDGMTDFHLSQLSAIRKLAMDRLLKVLLVSSTGVYPSNNQVVTEEDADIQCKSRGGVSLLEAEGIFAKSIGFQTTVVRFGGLYGPDRHPGRFLAGKKDLPGATNPVNMIHLEDCLGVIETIIEKNLWGETFNACSPSDESRKSFYDKAAADLGIDPPTFSDQSAPFKKVSSEKLIKMTGYQFIH